MGRHLTEGNPGEAETAEEGAATTGDLAAVHETSRACITRKHGETHVVLLLLQLVTKVCIFCNGLSFALIARDPAFSSHRGGKNYVDLSRKQDYFKENQAMGWESCQIRR